VKKNGKQIFWKKNFEKNKKCTFAVGLEHM
jgi:hypothetical protein